MISLRGRALSATLDRPLTRELWRLVSDKIPGPDEAVIGSGGGTLNVVRSGGDAGPNTVVLPPHLDHLDGGDIIAVSPDGRRIEVLWRARSRHNSLLLTERCDNYCLMCSQPPKERDDSRLLRRASALVRMLPPTAHELGFTGGEPTLYGSGLVSLLRTATQCLPDTEFHLLSNGRRFADPGFTAEYASVRNPRLMVGIPLFGAEPSLHDYVVQARGAFDETVSGILALAQHRQRIEIRVVLQKNTAPAIVEIAGFIARNLPFVEKVALMGLEMTGLARANLAEVWTDPYEYRNELAEAALLLRHAGIRTDIYNHQLCVLPRRVWPLAVRSISDWKNEYLSACMSCSVQEACGGLFASSAKHRHSDHIAAIPHPTPRAREAISSAQPQDMVMPAPP
ncbi:His-Xaa-Ser system radical SAM maturase HxsC [Winogradskya humida]|uniref:His-Xaa-Ser system radical SAM maturase HxsC n=1 Tax=Winogradskya humida TaxID=113566 RepID=A0ABQ3ZJ87_9ACTN|nr:His-Xaa-Ser system radical SAM maturase HxsC [Actinoplanes humidus]GIE18617.1 His-Xaa-Ser system radical SAM maturase HxsC [Actinoplanes humidus]